MKLVSHLLLFLASTLTPLSATPPPVPPGNGQIEQPIEFFPDPDPPPSDPTRQFAGQQTTTDKLVLTASNGFFDPGIRAGGESAIKDAAESNFIGPDFDYLDHWNQPGTILRWHLWIEHPGTLLANTHLAADPDEAGGRLVYQLGDTSHTLTTRTQSDPAVPQGPPLAFTIPHPGWHTLVIRLESLSGPQIGKLHRFELFGPAATKARLLRARWRPAACHARFSSSAVEEPRLWVMSTRSSPTAAVSSYSPVTTPFGYYGTSFNADGSSGGSANFSLWSYGRGKPTPQERWSHMLAVGSPDATFGSFGHEGSGVKLRGNWTPFAGQKEVTLALRREHAPPWIHWFGYYLDPQTKRFRLFAAAAKWNGDRPMRSLNPGAFVEQPGPPDRRRGGDLTRDIHRRGWMLDEHRQWHPIDTMSTGKASATASKHWRTTGDGWFSMGMGGMAHRPGPGQLVRLDPAKQPLPEWLANSAIDDLFRLPATIGPRRFDTITRTSAKIHIPLSDLGLDPGQSAVVTVYHGPEDCLTFDRDLGYREVNAHFWPHHTEPTPVIEGDNTLQLHGLAPGTTHHLRLLVESSRGRIWSFETDRFTTLH